jgi:hypothetical protein
MLPESLVNSYGWLERNNWLVMSLGFRQSEAQINLLLSNNLDMPVLQRL